MIFSLIFVGFRTFFPTRFSFFQNHLFEAFFVSKNIYLYILRKKLSLLLTCLFKVTICKTCTLNVSGYLDFKFPSPLREDTHKKNCFFFSGRTTKALPSLHQWLSGPCHFFFLSLIIGRTDFDKNKFSSIFGLQKAICFWQILFSNQ